MNITLEIILNAVQGDLDISVKKQRISQYPIKTYLL